jgi:Uma2 family endonuclease
MSEPLSDKTEYTREEYLAIEDQADYKSEYHQGEIFAMAGGSRNHSVICVNVIRRLSEAVDDKDCIVFDGNMKLDIHKANAILYPDSMVVCGEVEFYQNRTDAVGNPSLIVEVISPSTESFDRGKKFQLYRGIPSFQEYLLISQYSPTVERFVKQAENRWLYSVSNGLDGRVAIQSVGCELSLDHIYRKVAFDDANKNHRPPQR